MRRNKLKRRAEYGASALAIVGDPGWQGRWKAELCQRSQPAPESGLTPESELVLELGCGRAEFSLGLARLYPNRFFVGVDLRSVRMWAAAQAAEQEGLKNLFLMREDIFLIGQRFADAEVDEIWITFPDPFPKPRHANRRMTGEHFLNQYRRILRPGGLVKFKTDNADLFDYSLETIQMAGTEILAQTRNLHASELLNEENGILTTYERRFLAEGLPTHYVCFRFIN